MVYDVMLLLCTLVSIARKRCCELVVRIGRAIRALAVTAVMHVFVGRGRRRLCCWAFPLLPCASPLLIVDALAPA